MTVSDQPTPGEAPHDSVCHSAAAACATSHHGRLIPIIDWDVHHGNGTQTGFWEDPNMADPLGRMMVTATGFHAMASRMRELADDVCEGRLVGMQEGGYSPHYARYCTLAVVEGLSGQETGIGDSWAGSSEHDRALVATSPAEGEAINAVITAQRADWTLS